MQLLQLLIFRKSKKKQILKALAHSSAVIFVDLFKQMQVIFVKKILKTNFNLNCSKTTGK